MKKIALAVLAMLTVLALIGVGFVIKKNQSKSIQSSTNNNYGVIKKTLAVPLAKPNIVLINIDSLRADHMGIYGYNKETTPFLDSLFKQGSVFENAITPAYLTFQTDAAILSGLYPSQNNVSQ